MQHSHRTKLFLFKKSNKDFSYTIFPIKKNKCWENFKIMRKSLFKYSLYAHPEIGNFRVWQAWAATRGGEGQSDPGAARPGRTRRRECHTRFSEENRMHLICVPGSQFHTYDRLMNVISQDIAQTYRKGLLTFITLMRVDTKVFTRTTIIMKTRLHLHLPQASDWLTASSELLVVD
jgi:hypothetical protein